MPVKYWDKAWSLLEGCTPVSEACEHCWLASMAHRFAREGEPTHDTGVLTDEKGHFNGDIILCENRLTFKQWGEWRPHCKVCNGTGGIIEKRHGILAEYKCESCKPERGVYSGAGIFIDIKGHCVQQGDYWEGKACAMDKVTRKNKTHHLLDGKEYIDLPWRKP